jgi:hypothetical protein
MYKFVHETSKTLGTAKIQKSALRGIQIQNGKLYGRNSTNKAQISSNTLMDTFTMLQKAKNL